MYTSRPRPAPSKAALRVLYQLAYISSGTAVGAGVLCAEERRRRTQIVQRVADNAKKIRQHPRYVANAALAVRADGGGDGEVLPGEGLDGTARKESRRKRGGQTGGALEGDRVAKGPGLPSVVESGYDATVNGQRRRKRSFRPLEAEQEQSSTTRRPQRRIPKLDAPASSLSESLEKSRLSRRPLWTPEERAHPAGLQQPNPASSPDAHFDKASTTADLDARQFFDLALTQGDLARCAELLRGSPTTIVSTRTCNDYIRACDRCNEHDFLLDIFFRKEPLFELIDLQSPYPDTRYILACVCSVDVALESYFQELYRSLDDQWKRQVDVRRCRSLLKGTWRSTRNIDAVHVQLRRMKAHIEQAGALQSSRLVDKTMVGIYTTAGRTNDALEVLARLYKTEPHSLSCIIRAALVYARRQSWDQFYKALRLAEAQVPQAGQPKHRKAWNNIVQEYIKHHSASQIWRFISYLQENFDYWPDRFANRIVLQAFVAKKVVTLIPSWLRMLEVIGRPFDMDGETAAHLLRRYYEDHRPSHVLIMWFARNLAHCVPSFDPLAFKALIVESIGHDVSGVVERNAPWQQDHALQRLARVEDATDHVPSPGSKHSRKLHFSHPNTEKAELNAASREPFGGAEHGAVEVKQDRRPSKVPLESALERQMRGHLHLGQTRKVLQIYETSLKRLARPTSPIALTLAVRASLAESGDDAQAMQMITHAENAGANIVNAMEPVLIHRMRNYDPSRIEADNLRGLVSRYYRASRESGFIPHHRVGVTVANKLIQSHRPDLAIDLLCEIVQSPYAKDRPVDMVFMTMMIRAQIGRRSPPGVMHWAHESLKMDLRVTPGFLRELKHGLKTLHLLRKQRTRLISCIQACKARADEQKYEGKILGKKLVSTIAKCMRPKETVDIDARMDMDRAIFGDTMVQSGNASKSGADGADPGQKRLTRRERMARRREGPCLDEFEGVRHSNRLTDIHWARKYRAFLRRPMVLEDGRYVPFRYYMPSQSMKWRSKERMRREQLRQRREAHWDEGSVE